MTKIVCLGAGSYSFGLTTLVTLLNSPTLTGCEIALVDTNPESLDLISKLTNTINNEWGCQKYISSHDSYKTAIKDANFVVNAIEVQPREKLWKQDYELTLKFGVRQPYAENGGPGAFAHAARNVNTILEIVRDMELVCPDALFINFSNPMHRLCYLIHKYSRIRTVGLCHQVAVGYAMVAKTLAHDLGIEAGDDFVSSHADPKNQDATAKMAFLGLQNLIIIAAGLNHFTWMLQLEDRKNGRDMYPLFRERWNALSHNFEPLTRKVFQIFGLFPIPGDEHLCEYLPWLSDQNTRPWTKYDLSLYDWDLNEAMRSKQWKQVSDIVLGYHSLDSLRNPHSEGAIEIIESTISDSNLYWEAMNIPNNGLIKGLPSDAIVEVPGYISKHVLSGLTVGSLPKAITGLLHREVITSQLCIDSVVHGDKQLALQSILLDPLVNDIDTGEKILNQILTDNKEYLPQFWM